MSGVRRRWMRLAGVLALTLALGAGAGALAQGPIDVFPERQPRRCDRKPRGHPQPHHCGRGPAASPVDSSCAPDTEPNDTPETAPVVDGPGCIAGTLPDGDQDLYLWTITDAQATQPWDLTIDGVEGTATAPRCCRSRRPRAKPPWSSATRSWRSARHRMPSSRRPCRMCSCRRVDTSWASPAVRDPRRRHAAGHRVSAHHRGRRSAATERRRRAQR